MKFSNTITASVSAIAVTIFTIVAYGQSLPDRGTSARARVSNHKEFDEPEQDAEKAAKGENFSLSAIYGYAPIVAGITGDYEILRRKFRITMIEGTEHAVCEDPNSYNNIAKRYAVRFNPHMFHTLGCNPAKPMETCKNY